MKETSAPNRLIHSSSPYLLQHAHNPVDWFEWEADAFEKAQRENKPILVSIGYSACHWCHVMERETFENKELAALMNKGFVCIKVDREERPDVDHMYMDAVQALGINGGWPLNVFLTPDKKPFYGGTYFSPQAWEQVLNNIQRAYHEDAAAIGETAEELHQFLKRQNIHAYLQENNLALETQKCFDNIAQKFDRREGGLSKAPKFIMPSVWQWLLRYHYLTKDTMAISQVECTLDKIAAGGIYDQIGGGFARYSVDGRWFAPHFEKMLYDNAQLLSLYAEAYASTKNPLYADILEEIYSWLDQEMTSPQGGFFSALDADSEGEEGKFYVWSAEEFNACTEPNAPSLAAYYHVSPTGNWEHGKNILFRTTDEKQFLREQGLTAQQWNDVLKKGKAALYEKRATRIWPGLDDKIITSWNGMTIVGLCDAYLATGNENFLTAAKRCMQFLENEMMEGTTIYRSFRQSRSSVNGFLDDYAFVIQAALKLYSATFDEYFLFRGELLLQAAIEEFYDSDDGYFWYSASPDESIIRKKELFDTVIPSSNAVMARNLFYLGTLLDRPTFVDMAIKMTRSLHHLITGELNYMSYWGIVAVEIDHGISEVVVAADDVQTLALEWNRGYLPFSLLMGKGEFSRLPLLQDKERMGGKDTFYVCFQKTCQRPVHSVREAKEQVGKE